MYELVVIKFPDYSAVKIISKEKQDGSIYFTIIFGKMSHDNNEFTPQKIHYNKGRGITKEEFDEFIAGILSKMTNDKEVKIHDLSKYKTLKEQYALGLEEGFLKATNIGGE